MNQYVKSYLVFVGFTLVSAIIVRPLAKQMNIPFLSDI